VNFLRTSLHQLIARLNELFAWLTYDGTDVTISKNVSLSGDATSWDDILVSISNVRLPTSNAPTWTDYDGSTGGVAFPFLAFDVGDIIYFDIQTSHSMKLNDVLNQHIHFTLPNTTNIGDKFQFQLDVLAGGVNDTWTEPTESPYTAEHTVASGDNTNNRVMTVGSIDGYNTTISTIFKMKLTRIAATANEYGSSVYISFIDGHYQRDSLGSDEEYVK
jgi:hypothetical protein